VFVAASNRSRLRLAIIRSKVGRLKRSAVPESSVLVDIAGEQFFFAIDQMEDMGLYAGSQWAIGLRLFSDELGLDAPHDILRTEHRRRKAALLRRCALKLLTRSKKFETVPKMIDWFTGLRAPVTTRNPKRLSSPLDAPRRPRSRLVTSLDASML
jgi:hypothetical protein